MSAVLPDFDYSTLNGASILVTGGTGSFGQAFINRVSAKAKPARLVVFSRDELKQVEMAQKYNETDYPYLRFFIGDIRDVERLTMAMRNIDIVIHTAALKHVPVAEYNPFECIHTNVYGTENVARAALRAGVRKVLTLSTDKAASPINLYGASKLAAEKVITAANIMSAGVGTRFSIARYGNVLGSRGSIIPLFNRLLSQGATSLPITDVRMTRFSISLEQSIDFVLSCLNMMRGGEVFIPKIPSMRISDLAKCMAPNLPYHLVGIRPSEKLHELLIADGEARTTLELADRFVIEPQIKVSGYISYRDRGATPLREDYIYSSDKNHDWLEGDQLRDLLNRLGLLNTAPT